MTPTHHRPCRCVHVCIHGGGVAASCQLSCCHGCRVVVHGINGDSSELNKTVDALKKSVPWNLCT